MGFYICGTLPNNPFPKVHFIPLIRIRMFGFPELRGYTIVIIKAFSNFSFTLYIVRIISKPKEQS